MEHIAYAENEVTEELEPDEQIIWTGQPDTKKLFTRADIFLVPFTLLWTGMPVFMVTTTRNIPFSIFMILPLFFIVIGMYITFGRFIVKTYRKKRTIYALTDRRVIEITDTSRRRVKTAVYSRIPNLSYSQGRSGGGSITFGNENAAVRMYANTGMDFMMLQREGMPAFYDLEDVAEPLGIIRERMREMQ